MLELDVFIVLAQLINFGILYGIFKYFIADTLSKRLDERKKQLKKLDTAEEHYEEKMKLAKKQRDEMMQEARQTTSALMKESEIVAKQKAQAIMKTANAQAMSILESGKRELEKERLTMLAQMKEHIVDVSLRLNEKMFGNAKASKDLIEKELETLK